MDRRYFLTSTTVVTSTAVLVPSLIYAAEAASEAVVRQSQELIEYTSETVNKLNDYALGAILPSLVPLMLYAYTQELMYIILFLFLLISSGIILL
jgi:cyanate lyase